MFYNLLTYLVRLPHYYPHVPSRPLNGITKDITKNCLSALISGKQANISFDHARNVLGACRAQSFFFCKLEKVLAPISKHFFCWMLDLGHDSVGQTSFYWHSVSLQSSSSWFSSRKFTLALTQALYAAPFSKVHTTSTAACSSSLSGYHLCCTAHVIARTPHWPWKMLYIFSTNKRNNSIIICQSAPMSKEVLQYDRLELK